MRGDEHMALTSLEEISKKEEPNVVDFLQLCAQQTRDREDMKELLLQSLDRIIRHGEHSHPGQVGIALRNVFVQRTRGR